jgi:transcriptional regulator with XRE-family HTH domain
MALGNKIKEIRKIKGMSLTKLSQITGLSRTTITEIENVTNGRNPTTSTLDKLAKALHVSVEDFFKEEKTKEKIMKEIDKKETDKKESINQIHTIAAHFEGKKLTPKKMKLIEHYMDALFDDDEE